MGRKPGAAVQRLPEVGGRQEPWDKGGRWALGAAGGEAERESGMWGQVASGRIERGWRGSGADKEMGRVVGRRPWGLEEPGPGESGGGAA